MKKYIKRNNILNSINDKIRVVSSLPLNGVKDEIIIVKFDGIYKYSNNSWNKILGFGSSGSDSPIGELKATINPNGIDTTKWLECNGQTFNSSVFPKLYTHLGNNIVPDLRGMTLVGVGVNSTDNIVTHDSFTLGEFKPPQIQDHAHCFVLSANAHTHAIYCCSIEWSYNNIVVGQETLYHTHSRNGFFSMPILCTRTVRYGSGDSRQCNLQIWCCCRINSSTSSIGLGITDNYCFSVGDNGFDFYLGTPNVSSTIGTVVDSTQGPTQWDIFSQYRVAYYIKAK